MTDQIVFPKQWADAVEKWQDATSSEFNASFRKYLPYAIEHFRTTLIGQESIRNTLKTLAHIGLSMEGNVESANNSRNPLAHWLAEQLNSKKPRQIKKAAPDGGFISLSKGAPEVLPAFASQFDVDVVVISSRTSPLVFGDVSIGSTRPIIALFHARDTMKEQSSYSVLIATSATGIPRKPRKAVQK
jgi:hypothetical protein